MFEYLKKAINKNADNDKKATAFFIKNGYFPTWAEEHRNERDQGLRRYLTAKAWADYQGGKITRAKAIEKATARAFAEIDKTREKYLQRLHFAENAPELSAAYISVEWVRSRTWGANPHAEVLAIGIGTTSGTASGCGYDKRSAAISEAFNKQPAFLKLLYLAEEKRLKGVKTRKQSRRDIVGYGSGYGVLPCFEGGCGVSVYRRIFNNCGYIFEDGASGKMFDNYTIRKA